MFFNIILLNTKVNDENIKEWQKKKKKQKKNKKIKEKKK